MVLNRIKELRKKKNLTQKQLAALVGLDYTHVGRIENGERTLDVEYLPIFAKALDCEPWELLPLDMQPKINPKDLELIKLLKAITKSNEAIDTDTNINKAG